MKEKVKNTITQFLKFGIIGAINSVLFIVIYTFLEGMGVWYAFCNAIAWITTVTISFILNSTFVFSKTATQGQSKFKAFFKVVTSYAITGLGLNTLLLVLWIDVLHIPAWAGVTFPFIAELGLPFSIPDMIPPILNMAITTPINFLLNKFWAYRKH